MDKGHPDEVANVNLTFVNSSQYGVCFLPVHRGCAEKKQFCGPDIRQKAHNEASSIDAKVGGVYRRCGTTAARKGGIISSPVYKDINCQPWDSRLSHFVGEIFTPREPWSQKEMS